MSDFKVVQLLNPIQLNTNINPTGVYDNTTAYGIGDSVSYGNNSYLCITTTVGNIPTDTAYWQLFASSATNKIATVVRNQTGVTIPKMSVVYFSGISGNTPTIDLAQASTESLSTKTVGITSASINDNSVGEVVLLGLADNLDTTAFAAASSLFLSPTVPGGLTTTKPSAPNHLVSIGFVTRSHPTSGTIEIRIQNGFEIEELHNVAISSLSDNQVLKYDLPNLLWKNETLVKSDVGLSNVDNTSDISKPVSTATQTALNLKIDSSLIGVADGVASLDSSGLVPLSQLPATMGADGLSAYEVALANGFVGTEVAWLASLVGADGANGTNGTNGTNGDSAYQVAVANGFVGTESAWLISLIGADGDSAYQVALNNGFVGTQSAWLASLVGAAGSPGTNGTNGTNGTDGSVWLSGVGVPSSVLGVDGDYYINTSNSDVYKKASGTFTFLLNIKGATGDAGAVTALDAGTSTTIFDSLSILDGGEVI